MNYEEAVAYIEETPKFTKKNSLEHTKECLRRLGNPQEKFKVIHVAGTNGKGSTCAFLTSILREAGYSCGLFTSPHLVKINERFQINEVNIDDDTFLKAFERVKVLADELVAEGSYHPTYFEMLFLMGMVIFAEAGVDYVTLETGLGGRLDATNSFEHPFLSVITSIGLDHTEISKVVRIAGRVLLVAGAALDALGLCDVIDGDLHDAHQKIGKKTYSTAASIGGSWAGGALGAKGGALAGAAIGTAILPGLGTAVGGIAGGLLLGVAGSSLRKWVIDITDVGE